MKVIITFPQYINKYLYYKNVKLLTQNFFLLNFYTLHIKHNTSKAKATGGIILISVVIVEHKIRRVEEYILELSKHDEI